MKEIKCKVALNITLGILFLFFCINVSVANNTGILLGKDSVMVKVDTVRSETLSTPTRPNPVNQIFDVLPEICESFGYDAKKVDVSLKLMSKSLSEKIKVLNNYAAKQTGEPTSKSVKVLLAELNLKIGGSSFATRELKPEFIAKFTPENIRKVSGMLTTLKQNYDISIKQKTVKAKFDVFKNIQKQALNFKDVELFTGFAKEYGQWLSELVPLKLKGQTITKTSSLSVADTVQAAQLKLEKATQIKRNLAIFDKAYTLAPEQVKISALPYNGGDNCQLVKIVKDQNETKVTIAIPIHFKSNWISTDSTFCIIDKQTNDCYVPRRLESGIPMSRIIIVKDCAQKMIEITYVYSALKKSVVLVDILDATTSTLQIPSNKGDDFQLKNIFIDDYSERKVKGNVYR